jgi:hypothetical protein
MNTVAGYTVTNPPTASALQRLPDLNEWTLGCDMGFCGGVGPGFD